MKTTKSVVELEKSPQSNIEKASNVSLTDTPERFRLGEMGYMGLNIFNGVSTDELKKELTWPYSIKTFKQMSYHSTCNAALTLYDNLIGKVRWRVVPPADATARELRQTQKVSEMLTDMDGQSFSEFIRDVMSMNTYGFSVHEKVYRKRLKANGSKHDDGIIGWKKLPIRNQETIEKFLFSDDGNDIIGVKQNLSMVNDYYNRYGNRQLKEVNIPKSKFMLFRAGRHKGDPYGKSLLRDAYLSWRYLTALEEIEANGVARDLGGLPILRIPAQFMSDEASPSQKAAYANYQNIVRNIHMNSQSGLILPSVFDEVTKQPLFSIELLTSDGKKNFDTTKVKEYYKNLILTCMFADVLTIGQSSGGSFALAEVKNSLTGSAAEAMLRTVLDVINNDLIRQTYELNGWDTSRLCTIDYEELEVESLETLSKAVQRYMSTGAIEVDRPVLNRIRESIGVDALPETLDPQDDLRPGMTSRSGDGMAVGTTGNGTATSVSGTDTSSNNLENTG